MTEPRKSSIDELCDLLKDSGLEVTFDMYRDNTKGCGVWCRGWNREATIFCGNHMEAIRRGDYVMPDGDIQKHIRKLYQELQDALLIIKTQDQLMDPERIAAEARLREKGLLP